MQLSSFGCRVPCQFFLLGPLWKTVSYYCDISGVKCLARLYHSQPCSCWVYDSGFSIFAKPTHRLREAKGIQMKRKKHGLRFKLFCLPFCATWCWKDRPRCWKKNAPALKPGSVTALRETNDWLVSVKWHFISTMLPAKAARKSPTPTVCLVTEKESLRRHRGYREEREGKDFTNLQK